MIPRGSRPVPRKSSKPRASGDDPTALALEVGDVTVNPARAGMILARRIGIHCASGKPRASGDDPSDVAGEGPLGP